MVILDRASCRQNSILSSTREVMDEPVVAVIDYSFSDLLLLPLMTLFGTDNSFY